MEGHTVLVLGAWNSVWNNSEDPSGEGRAMGGWCAPFLEKQHILSCCLLTPHFQAKWEISEYPIKVKIMFNG